MTDDIDATNEEAEADKATYRELQAQARDLGISAGGTYDELAERIEAASTEKPGEEDVTLIDEPTIEIIHTPPPPLETTQKVVVKTGSAWRCPVCGALMNASDGECINGDFTL